MRPRVPALLAAIAALAPCFAWPQSAELVRSFQNFESAKAAHKNAEAMKYVRQSIKLSEAAGDTQNLIELLRNVGDYAQQSGDDTQAAAFYSRALELQSARLGPEHPD